jgi:hypothetical protein
MQFVSMLSSAALALSAAGCETRLDRAQQTAPVADAGSRAEPVAAQPRAEGPDEIVPGGAICLTRDGAPYVAPEC